MELRVRQPRDDDPFWVPTIYGIEDAAALLGLPEVQWTGSDSSDIGQMVDAFEAAIAGGANGIAVSLVDLEAFNEPVQAAPGRQFAVGVLQRRRPNARMSYTGQDLYGSGTMMSGSSRSSARARWGCSSPPGQLNIQPRIDGALDAIAESGAAIEAQDIATGPDLSGGAGEHRGVVPRQHRRCRDVRRRRRQYAGRGPGRAEPGARDQGLLGAGGYDLLPTTVELLAEGVIDFTIDQQPYLQDSRR